MTMTDKERELANKLQEISYEGEYTNLVFAWLTYRGIKPVSVIDLPKDEPSTPSLTNWITESGLSFSPDPTNSDLAIISNSPEKIEVMSKIFRIKSPILEMVKCEYFGFPEESAYAYMSQMYNLPESKKHIRAARTFDIEKNFNEYWKPYIQYMMRADNVLDDSQVAKRWFDICALEIPEIHRKFIDQYNKSIENNRNKQIDLLNSLESMIDISIEEKESLKQVLLRDQDSGWVQTTVDNKQVILDWFRKARISNEVDISNQYLIFFTTSIDSIDAFRQLNTLSSDEARVLRQKYFS